MNAPPAVGYPPRVALPDVPGAYYWCWSLMLHSLFSFPFLDCSLSPALKSKHHLCFSSKLHTEGTSTVADLDPTQSVKPPLHREST